MNEEKTISELTVKEFRALMQQCLNDDRAYLLMKDRKSFTVRSLVESGMSYTDAVNKVDRDWGKWG